MPGHRTAIGIGSLLLPLVLGCDGPSGASTTGAGTGSAATASATGSAAAPSKRAAKVAELRAAVEGDAGPGAAIAVADNEGGGTVSVLSYTGPQGSSGSSARSMPAAFVVAEEGVIPVSHPEWKDGVLRVLEDPHKGLARVASGDRTFLVLRIDPKHGITQMPVPATCSEPVTITDTLCGQVALCGKDWFVVAQDQDGKAAERGPCLDPLAALWQKLEQRSRVVEREVEEAFDPTARAKDGSLVTPGCAGPSAADKTAAEKKIQQEVIKKGLDAVAQFPEPTGKTDTMKEYWTKQIRDIDLQMTFGCLVEKKSEGDDKKAAGGKKDAFLVNVTSELGLVDVVPYHGYFRVSDGKITELASVEGTTMLQSYAVADFTGDSVPDELVRVEIRESDEARWLLLSAAFDAPYAVARTKNNRPWVFPAKTVKGPALFAGETLHRWNGTSLVPDEAGDEAVSKAVASVREKQKAIVALQGQIRGPKPEGFDGADACANAARVTWGKSAVGLLVTAGIERQQAVMLIGKTVGLDACPAESPWGKEASSP